MRNAFVDKLRALAKDRKDIYLLTADLGFKLFDAFRREFPERFINMGVAEQNMVGVASGLSLTGKNVYCYSMIPFLTMRTLEFIRINLCYQNLNVKLVGVGCGLTYGLEGLTHHAIEDIAVMRALPNMTVVAPGDPLEVHAIMEQSVEYPGPLYVRLGGNNDPIVHCDGSDIEIGKASVVRKGKDVTFLATGTALPLACRAADLLEKQDIEVGVISVHTVMPLDEEVLHEYAQTSKCLVTVEEHSTTGGLGSAVAELLLESGYRGKFIKIGLPHEFGNLVGTAAYLRRAYGLTPEAICERIMQRMGQG